MWLRVPLVLSGDLRCHGARGARMRAVGARDDADQVVVGVV
jgi:hypothetical protein